MANLRIVQEDGEILESDTFVAVVLRRDGEMYYSKTLSSTKHLGMNGHLIVASGLLSALTGAMEEIATNSGIQLLFEEKEVIGERIENEEEGDGDN